MATPATEFYNRWIVDARTGERRRTTYKLSRANAERAFPGAEPDLNTHELREIQVAGPTANSRPGAIGNDVLSFSAQTLCSRRTRRIP